MDDAGARFFSANAVSSSTSFPSVVAPRRWALVCDEGAGTRMLATSAEDDGSRFKRVSLKKYWHSPDSISGPCNEGSWAGDQGRRLNLAPTVLIIFGGRAASLSHSQNKMVDCVRSVTNYFGMKIWNEVMKRSRCLGTGTSPPPPDKVESALVPKRQPAPNASLATNSNIGTS